MLGGLLILEARDLNHVIRIMSEHPGATMGPWEIRPIQDMTGDHPRQRTAARRQEMTGATKRRKERVTTPITESRSSPARPPSRANLNVARSRQIADGRPRMNFCRGRNLVVPPDGRQLRRDRRSSTFPGRTANDTEHHYE